MESNYDLLTQLFVQTAGLMMYPLDHLFTHRPRRDHRQDLDPVGCPPERGQGNRRASKRRRWPAGFARRGNRGHRGFDTRVPAAAILLAGAAPDSSHLTLNKGELEQVISTTGAIELSFLERGLVVLATIANVAPLMGFLGTVAGMIVAFESIAAARRMSNPATVSPGGIKVALLTTAAGLTIAIPVNIGYNYFVSRIDKLVVDMEESTQKVLNIAWDMEREGKLTVRVLNGFSPRGGFRLRGTFDFPGTR